MLLDQNEPAAVRVLRVKQADSPFIITCEHAGNRIPKSLHDLGLPKHEIERHIAWDIGAAAVAGELACILNTVAILQTYSRLVIDCNRPLESPTLVVKLSECTEIPGNRSVSGDQMSERIREVFLPYHERIELELDARKRKAQETVLVAVHSFTPRFKGAHRPWHIGVLYNHDPRFARIVRDLLRLDSNLSVGDNQPYAITDAGDYTIPVHGERRSIPHVEIEIRQDLIGNAPEQKAWAARLAAVLERAYCAFKADYS